jgi:hypothetical protein
MLLCFVILCQILVYFSLNEYNLKVTHTRTENPVYRDATWSAELIPFPIHPENGCASGMPKIAIAIAGTLRFWKVAHPSIRQHLIESNPNICFQVFLCVSDFVEIPVPLPVNMSEIERLYKPAAVSWEMEGKHISAVAFAEQVRKWGKNFQQVLRYAEQHRFRWDLVIRLRADTWFGAAVDLNQYLRLWRMSCANPSGHLAVDQDPWVRAKRVEMGWPEEDEPPAYTYVGDAERGGCLSLPLVHPGHDQPMTANEEAAFFAKHGQGQLLVNNKPTVNYGDGYARPDFFWKMDQTALVALERHLSDQKANFNPEPVLAELIANYNISHNLPTIQGFAPTVPLGYLWRGAVVHKERHSPERMFFFNWMPPCMLYDLYKALDVPGGGLPCNFTCCSLAGVSLRDSIT